MKILALAALGGLLSSVVYGQNPSHPPVVAEDSLESLLATKVVTASRFSDNLVDAPGVMTVVTRDEIARFGGLSLREILGRVAGLDWTSGDFSDRSTISVRGDQLEATGSHVLYLINGRPTRSTLEAGVSSDLLEAFPVGTLERIEVIEGPGSVLYGSNAFSGVINLITRKENGKAGGVRSFGGGNAPLGGSAEGFYRNGDFHVSGGTQFHKSNQGTTPILNAPNAPAVLYSIYDNSRGVFAEAGYKGFSAMVASMEWRAPYALEVSTGESRWRRTFADLGYDLQPARHWDMGLHASYTWTGLKSFEVPSIERSAGELELDWVNSIAIDERNRITFGTNFNYQAGLELFHSPEGTFPTSDASLSGGGFYAQFEHKLTDGIKLIGGFQANKIENLPLHTVPRAGVIWSPASHWFVKGLFGQAYRAPSLNETHLQDPHLQGTLDLRPELAATFDLALLYQTRRAQTSINYFRSRLSDLIVQGFGADGVLHYQNSGALELEGIQWEAKAYVRPEWLVEGSMLYRVSRNDRALAPDIPSPHLPTPPFGAKAGISYAEHRGWTVSVFDVFSSLVPGYASLPNPKPRAHQLVSAHARLSLEKYFGPGAKGVAVFAHGDNIINHAIWQPLYGNDNPTTLPIQRGRSIYYGLEFSFKRE